MRSEPLAANDAADLPYITPFRGAALVFLLALAVRIIPVFIYPTLSNTDEIYQAMEQGHRLVFGYGLVPWEFDYAARSWLLAYASAAIMEASLPFGGQPALYVPLIGIALSALAAMVPACTYLYARRFYSNREALIAGLVPALWIDCIFYSSHMAVEAVAASVLLLGLFLLMPGRPAFSQPRIVMAGFLLGLTLMLRIQLGPAIVLVWLWRDEGASARRTVLMSAGAVAAIAAVGLFDAVTWSYPFEPLWRNFNYNFFRHVADDFGTNSWWTYIRYLAIGWGGTFAIFIPLAIVGARRMPLFMAMAVTIIVSHSIIAHKEPRFIYPAILLMAVLAGMGLAQVSRWIATGIATQGTAIESARRMVLAAVLPSWIVLCILNALSYDYRDHWNLREHDSLLASTQLGRISDLCGIGLYGLQMYSTGGYTFIHRRVPIYAIRSNVAALAPTFNAMLYDTVKQPDGERQLTALGYHTEKCFDEICLAHRAGPCKIVPMTRPYDEPPQGVTGPPPTPQIQGVTDLSTSR